MGFKNISLSWAAKTFFIYHFPFVICHFVIVRPGRNGKRQIVTENGK